ncbi:MAG: HAMP domain-containing histidine kinase [Clostridia bacterium]|nr:HAMP domain-containing histidine kinase [Clostridia bacterium]
MKKKTNRNKSRVRRFSLRARYTLMLSLILLFSFALLGASLVIFSGRYAYNQHGNLLSENAHNVADSASTLLSGGYISMFGEGDSSMAALGSSLDLISTSINADVFICDTSGSIIMCRDYFEKGAYVGNYCELHDEIKIRGETLARSLEGQYLTVGSIDELHQENHYIAGEPVTVMGRTVAVVFAIAPVSNSIVSFIEPIVQLMFVSMLVALAFAVVAIYFLAHSLTRPLKKMARATRSYAAGDFSPRINIHRNDEIGELAQAFNTMANSLEQLESSRRNFVANVSHELKTPMTTIGGFIDGMLDGTITPEQQERYLKIVSGEVKRLSRMVVSMLNLSKIEAGQLDLNIKNVDLSGLVLTSFLNFERKISEAKIEVRGLEYLDAHTVRADEDMLGQVVYNIIDNAVKFTPEHGYISVSIKEADGMVQTRISNSGSGVAQEELDKIFERFYKVDKSRSTDTKSTGLGLHIVRSILELHGGKIHAVSEEGRYTEFIFELPYVSEK